MTIKARDNCSPPGLAIVVPSGEIWGGWGSFSMPPGQDARDGRWRGACAGTKLPGFLLPSSSWIPLSSCFGEVPPPLLPHIHTMLLAFQILE